MLVPLFKLNVTIPHRQQLRGSGLGKETRRCLATGSFKRTHTAVLGAALGPDLELQHKAAEAIRMK